MSGWGPLWRAMCCVRFDIWHQKWGPHNPSTCPGTGWRLRHTVSNHDIKTIIQMVVCFCWNGWFLGIFCHQNRQLQELLQRCWFPAWKQPVNPCFVKGESWKCYKLYPRPRFCRGLYIGHKQIYFLQFTSWSCFFDFLFVVGPAGPMLEKVTVKQLQEAPRFFFHCQALFYLADFVNAKAAMEDSTLTVETEKSKAQHECRFDFWKVSGWVGLQSHASLKICIYIYIHIWFTFFWCIFLSLYK